MNSKVLPRLFFFLLNLHVNAKRDQPFRLPNTRSPSAQQADLLYRLNINSISCKHSYWDFSDSISTLPWWPSGQGFGLVTRVLGVLIPVEAHFFFIFHLFIYYYFDVLRLPACMKMHLTYFIMTALHSSINNNLRKACRIWKFLSIKHFVQIHFIRKILEVRKFFFSMLKKFFFSIFFS